MHIRRTKRGRTGWVPLYWTMRFWEKALGLRPHFSFLSAPTLMVYSALQCHALAVLCCVVLCSAPCRALRVFLLCPSPLLAVEGHVVFYALTAHIYTSEEILFRVRKNVRSTHGTKRAVLGGWVGGWFRRVAHQNPAVRLEFDELKDGLDDGASLAGARGSENYVRHLRARTRRRRKSSPAGQ